MRAAALPARTNCAGPANAVASEKLSFSERIRSKTGYGNEQPPGFSLLPSAEQSPKPLLSMLPRRSPCAVQRSTTSCEGSRADKERSITASIRLKMAVFAPMPSASVSTATAAKPGLFASIRSPKRKS